MPDVFELTIDPARRAASTFSSSDRLISSCSTIASMIQSLSLMRASSSKPPVATSFHVSGVKNGSGFNERARLSPSRAASAVTSSRSAGTPALAKCAAI